MNDPKVLLLDEPYRALDSLTKSVMHEALLEIFYKNQVTIFFITHDLEEAIFLGHRVVIMTTRPCRPKKILDVDIPHPRDYSVLTTKRFREYLDETVRGGARGGAEGLRRRREGRLRMQMTGLATRASHVLTDRRFWRGAVSIIGFPRALGARLALEGVVRRSRCPCIAQIPAPSAVRGDLRRARAQLGLLVQLVSQHRARASAASSPRC